MKHVLSVYVENQPGVLVRVASMFSRREFNIDSLSVGITQSPEFSRITVVVHGDGNLIEQMIKQLEKMPIVRAVQRLDSSKAVTRGMTMIKVSADDNNRLDVLKMAELFRAHVVDVRRKTAARRWAHAWSRAASATVADALSTAALSMDADALERACTALDARILVAYNQKKAMDLLRDPLKWFGPPIWIDKTA